MWLIRSRCDMASRVSKKGGKTAENQAFGGFLGPKVLAFRSPEAPGSASRACNSGSRLTCGVKWARYRRLWSWI